jgi:hypothetical protein
VAHVAAVARRHGFTPASQAHPERPATAEFAAENLEASPLGESVPVEAGDRERARTVLAWVHGTLARERRRSNYYRQLMEVLGGGLKRGELALAASALLAYERQRRPESGPLGAPGARVDVEQALLERVRPGPETRFGLSFAHSFRDQQGRRLVWFAVGRQLVPGERYGLRATVKRHGSQRGETVTVHSRCRCGWLARERETPTE